MKPNLEQLAIRWGSLSILLLFLTSCAPTTVPVLEPNTEAPAKTASPADTASPAETPTGSPIVAEFPERGVTVDLPWQSYCPCTVEEQDFNSYKADFFAKLITLNVQENPTITPIQPVIYFVVRDNRNNEQKSFSPSMEITVHYDDGFVQEFAPGEESLLVLLILDHLQNSWYVAPNFKLNQGDNIATTTISSWTSHICWGR